MSTQIGSTLVFGAQAGVGREIARELRSLDIPCLAAVEGPESPGYDAGSVVIDFMDPEQLSHAMHGLECVVLPTLERADARALHDSILDAAVRAQVGHVIRISTIGADHASPNEWMRLNGQADQKLRMSSVTYSIFECAPFMQRLFGRIPANEGGLLRLQLPLGSARLPWLDLRDVAACILERVQGQNVASITYQLSGRQLLTGDQIAEGMSRALQRAVVYMNTPEQAYLAHLSASGSDPQSVIWERDYFRAIRNGEFDLPYGDIYRLLMSPPTTFSVFTVRQVKRRFIESVSL